MIIKQKKATLFVVFFLFLCFLGFSQQSKLDSIISKLRVYEERDSVRARLLVNAAWNSIYENEQDAFVYVNEAVDIAKEIQWDWGLVVSLRQKGVNYYVQRDYLSAVDTWQEALKIAENKNVKDKLLIASIYNNLGNVHADFKQYAKALENYKQCLHISEQVGNKENNINALSNIGYVYVDLNKIEKGIVYFNKALLLAKDESNKRLIASIIKNLGDAYKLKEDYNKALSFYEESAKIAEDIKDKYVASSALNSISELHIKLGKYDEAQVYSEKALQLAKEINTVEWQADSWKLLSDVFEKKGKTKDALKAYKNYIQLKDSIQSEDKKVALTRKEMAFKLERQEAKAKAELEKEKLYANLILTAAIFVVLGSIIAYVLYKRKRDAIEYRKIAEFKTKVAETELKALRSQMNPHFIFNAMSSIGDYMIKNDLETANEYLIKFSKLIRSILENSEKKWISLEEDLELTKLYIEIESLRLKDKIFYTFLIDKSIDVENTMVPPLILQPFIENSIWHGIAKKEGKGTIKICAKKNEKHVVFSVDDDGVGRKKGLKQLPNHTAMGVNITKNRLAIINNQDGFNNSVKMIDKVQGVRIEVKIPLELRF
ncbi:tetratricopeptide repeat-containing sensor histidine kinase [Maribacter vaceletii]|nr:tetratricopeptide repeat protein [Maribacter vaceletii]